MSLKKSVLCALLVFSSITAFADQIGWGSLPTPTPSYPSFPSDPWGHDNDQYERKVELDVRRYFEQRGSLDLLIDSYTRNQLLGRRVREIKISMATEMGRGQASLLVNNRQLEASITVGRDVREYSFRLDSFSNEVGRSLRSLSLEMQGRFYVDKVAFVLDEDRGPTNPFPIPSQTEVLRQQINQTFEREGGLNLFRQFPLYERQGQVVKRVTIVAMSRGYSGTAMLLENSESFGQVQAVGSTPTRISFELRNGERIGNELQSLRLQFNGSITVLEVSVEIEAAYDSREPRYPRDPRDPGEPRPREPRFPTPRR